MNMLALLLQSDNGGSNALGALLGGAFGLVWLAFIVLMIAALWKVFTKAGEPGWAAIVPIYNIIVLLKIVGRPLWWIVLMLIPFVNIIIAFVLAFDLAKRFGKGAGFGIGLIILPFVFYPILAWGDSRYSAAPAMA
ncbi:MAG TPA: DUF5684 domain-containing protein [Thermoanaerobaculia bacterium]|jgi:ABC-type sulfate transport system permease subunit|nr:DUF5684 domain-containing protein [Thermoanaerobaculia bacterium]